MVRELPVGGGVTACQLAAAPKALVDSRVPVPVHVMVMPLFPLLTDKVLRVCTGDEPPEILALSK